MSDRAPIFVALRIACQALSDWWRRTYGDSITRQRHAVEEDARRLHGKVLWDD